MDIGASSMVAGATKVDIVADEHDSDRHVRDGEREPAQPTERSENERQG
jgi:hypothetical protein